MARATAWGTALLLGLGACGGRVDPPLPLTPADLEQGLAPPVGSVTAQGGTVSRLFFAVVGDTRPFLLDDSPGYPLEVIERIYAEMESLEPRPQFVVATGDYMNADPQGDEGFVQVALYQKAREAFHAPLFPVMGNHECDTFYLSNCSGLMTNNLRAFQTLLLPLGRTEPYYAVPFQAPDSSWTAKLVVVACNDWSQTQAAWLNKTLSQPTTYTLVAVHEPLEVTSPCQSGLTTALAVHPYDLVLAGHIHTFEHRNKELIVGTGGASLSSTQPFGFATVEQVPGIGFRVAQYDAATAAPIKSSIAPIAQTSH